MGVGNEEKGLSGSKSDSTPGSNAVDEDDALVLRNWFDSLSWQDPRYGNKLLLKLAALAMGSDEKRQRLLSDADVLVREVQSGAGFDPLEGVHLRFWENTPDTLHIILPPRAGAASEIPKSLKEALRSRTSLPKDGVHVRDDSAWDFGNFYDSTDRGNHGEDSPPDA
ncbi:hypothetical protein GCM10010347_20100 [Streptomyces cirratus]|uniref:Uncharacterized protein n=1 Tax=Streptomyces cirratus TaxID=68187 RepID=A0ABQ3ERS7_9ACTN|nr:hypothetical protein [Streptomyces cirratus]GHB50544.1 hypothetical protein GCM10010347_20100 [Streptomyces cirratus]